MSEAEIARLDAEREATEARDAAIRADKEWQEAAQAQADLKDAETDLEVAKATNDAEAISAAEDRVLAAQVIVDRELAEAEQVSTPSSFIVSLHVVLSVLFCFVFFDGSLLGSQAKATADKEQAEAVAAMQNAEKEKAEALAAIQQAKNERQEANEAKARALREQVCTFASSGRLL